MHTPFKEIEYAEYSKKPILSPLAFPNPSDTYPGNFTDVDASTNINGSYANGGTVDLARFDLNESEQERIDNLIIGLLRKAPKKPNVQQPFMDVAEGDDNAGQGIDTGTNTVAGTIDALGNLSGQLTGGPFGFGPIGMLASVVMGIANTFGIGKSTPAIAVVDDTETQEAIDNAVAAAQANNEQQDLNDPSLDGQFGPGFGYSDPADPDTPDPEGTETASGGLIKAPQAPKGHANGEQVAPQQQAPQEAIDPSTADTTMDTAGMGPMGLVDDMRGDDTTGVEDDLNMDTEEGAYVLNADSVELIGLRDLNDMVKEAIAVAIGSDIPLPKKIDPTKKVPIKISNGEFVIPAILVPIIGLENLEKMNKRGLAYREKNEEAQAAQEAPQGPQGPQGPQAGPAGPQAPQGPPPTAPEGVINLKRGGSVQQMNHLLQR